MEESPPAPPPKDVAYSTRMDIDRPSTAPSSGSKRKRSVHDENYHIQHRELENIDPDAHTPKRNRAAPDTSADEDGTPAQYRSIRRKKGTRNLSYLSLRHAASKQAQTRESKFQEGSLNDKPSQQPPSVFTKMPCSESDHSLKVDEMMEDYHDDVAVPRYSTVKQQRAHPRATVNMEMYKKDEGKGFFQFGRQIAASFNPANLWSRWWNEPKDDATHNTEEAEAKARVKAEVEAKYAEMKKAGQFKFQTVRRRESGIASTSEDLQTPRDSAIEIDSLQNTRSTFGTAGLMPPTDDTTSRSESEVPDTASKQNKGLKSRLHFKKPSLSNIKDDLKRVRSDLSLGAAARQRESSSSISPVKQDFENATLKRSQSKYDLKKTHKLSKRVSDLEVKLELAKKELDDALVEASPAPSLTTRYPTFKPSGTFKRSKFVPGKLPSLPSERILMAEQMKDTRGDVESEEEPMPRKAIDLNEIQFDDEIKIDNEDTVKASRGRSYPTRASALFNLDNNIIEGNPTDDPGFKASRSSELTQPIARAYEKMDPNSITNAATTDVPQVQTEGYDSLDAKLKALDKNMKMAAKAKQPKTKKRKSNGNDKLFKPGKDSDDDAEWEEAETPKKKRKSGGTKNDSSPKNQHTNGAAKKTSPPRKVAGNGRKTGGTRLDIAAKTAAQQGSIQDEVMSDAEAQDGKEEFSQDEAAGSDNEAVRNSLDSQDRTLDIVYEEEEEITTTQAKRAPLKAAPPTRFFVRFRSNSPHKRTPTYKPDVEEQIITRAAIAAKKHPGRSKSRSRSPPPMNGHGKATIVEEVTVSVKPGENGVPKLPKGANGSFESFDNLEIDLDDAEVLGSNKKRSFEWPDDVF